MATQVLTAGTTAASSSDLTVAAGDTLTVALNDAAGPLVDSASVVFVELKDAAGAYFIVDRMNANRPALILGAGVWRFSRPAGPSVGVFSA